MGMRSCIQPGTPEEPTGAKFRSKILGLTVVSEQNSAAANGDRDESGESGEHKDLVAQLQEELVRRQVQCTLHPAATAA